MTTLDTRLDHMTSEPFSSQQAGQLGTRPQTANVGEKERNVSMAAGAILTVQGLSRMSLPGLVTAAVGGMLLYRGATGYCHMYSAMGIDTRHQDGEHVADPIADKGIHVEQAMIINRSPEELYQFWRNFENLPQIMTHLIEVRRVDERRSHWVAKAPKIAGGKIEWDAEITADEPNSLIEWRSLPGSQVDHVGQIEFAPAAGDRGTEVHVFMDYVPPAGKLGHILAVMLNDSPARKMRDDLRNFKRLMETGEILTVEGQPTGTCMKRKQPEGFGGGSIRENRGDISEISQNQGEGRPLMGLSERPSPAGGQGDSCIDLNQ
jgi:uncharacterized membrane protein